MRAYRTWPEVDEHAARTSTASLPVMSVRTLGRSIISFVNGGCTELGLWSNAVAGGFTADNWQGAHPCCAAEGFVRTGEAGRLTPTAPGSRVASQGSGVRSVISVREVAGLLHPWRLVTVEVR